MNERIRQLAEQAGFPVIDEEIFTTSREECPITTDLEEFAETLIKECAGVCLEQRQYQTKEVYAQAVLSHFEVKLNLT